MSEMLVLNLGCGYQTSAMCTNIDWSIPVRLRGSRIGRRIAPLILQGERRAAYDSMDGTAMRHDLRKGIPFGDGTVDAVYHSHMLEHIDRAAVPGFLAEVRRVLRPGGTHRIVVPDLEAQARTYLETLNASLEGSQPAEAHEASVHELIEQLVRREAYGTSTRTKGRRRLENAILGDARKRGETHQWMWDRVSLPHELESAGFSDPKVASYAESRIPNWPAFLLDQDQAGNEYRPGSLYVEATA
ncbi:MAG: class I SAM-dependent methyltransferase [Aeromicrobium sp.]